MKVIQTCQKVVQYVSEAIGRIFAPNEEHYPATGIQPFEGELPKKSRWAD